MQSQKSFQQKQLHMVKHSMVQIEALHAIAHILTTICAITITTTTLYSQLARLPHPPICFLLNKFTLLKILEFVVTFSRFWAPILLAWVLNGNGQPIKNQGN